MRGILAVAIAAATTFMSGAPAAAQDYERSVRTVGDLARFCRMEDKAFCYGYVNGASQFYEALVAYEEVDVDPFVCPDGPVSEEEAVTSFLGWFDSHPDARDETAIDGLFRAWVAAFPCNGD